MVDSQNNISNNSRVKLLHFQLDTGDTVAVLDPTIPPPPYETATSPPQSNSNSIRHFSEEDIDDNDENTHLLQSSDYDDERSIWQRYWSGTFSLSHWKVLFHLSLISFPLALFAWIFCFVGSVVTASLLITLPVGLGFGWIVLVGARALARLELQIQNYFYPLPDYVSRKRPIFQRIRRVRPFGHIEYETSFYTNSIAMFQDAYSYRALMYFLLFRPPIALLILLITVSVVPLSLVLIIPLPVLLRLATAFGYWQANNARDVLS